MLLRSYFHHRKKNKKHYDDIKEKWEEFERQYWKKHPHEKYCHVCGETHKVELHHIIPRHVDPSKIFDENNLIPLCRCCHFRFGHLCDWDNYNPNIVKDAKTIFNMMHMR